ncbi:MAG: YeeE/YedE family protein [Bdellovibrionales bacterium]|nr:YeeE/YedE family protein [Bdellovibrionales bacterium]
MNTEFLLAMIGGVLIGFSATKMFILKGRVAGISGIVSGILFPQANEWMWRVFFALGLLGGGLVLRLFYPQALENNFDNPMVYTLVGGFLVGYGTLLGNGCTSGHGVCGISRLSLRSIVATATFMLFGILTVYIIQHVVS